MAASSDDQIALTQAPPFSFQPPAGGDLTLKSSDGATFVVHSVLLGLASRVFADMLATPTESDIVELAEDAETISLMVAFVYPVIRPTVNTIHLLEKAMHVAHKYDIEVISKTLVHNLEQQRSVIREDPLRVFRLAKNCNFREVQTLAAKLINQGHYDLLHLDGIIRLAKELPESAHIIGMVGSQGVRAKYLEFLATGSTMIWPNTDSTLSFSHSQYMICYSCWNATASQTSGWYRPGWLGVWSQRLSYQLTRSLLDECSSYFELAYLAGIKSGGVSCATCVDAAFSKPWLFNRWAKDTRLRLEQVLAPLDVLYTL